MKIRCQSAQAMFEFLIIAAAIILGLALAMDKIREKIGVAVDADGNPVTPKSDSLIQCVRSQMDPNTVSQGGTTADNADVFFGLDPGQGC